MTMTSENIQIMIKTSMILLLGYEKKTSKKDRLNISELIYYNINIKD
jgi:hypothetical protein